LCQGAGNLMIILASRKGRLRLSRLDHFVGVALWSSHNERYSGSRSYRPIKSVQST
jgi:hypothetical protein